jgi:hypothetical protein
MGCNSLPKNTNRKEYNSVRDYVSINISGMTYIELQGRLNNQKPPEYFPDGGLFDLPYYRDNPGSDFSKYNGYMMEISNKLNNLINRYEHTDMVEDFYLWSVRNYDE